MQFKAFDKFVCVGDSRTVDYGPFTIRAALVADSNTSPYDYDSYDAAGIAAWNNDEWQYVGVVLSVWVDDVCLDDNVASLWGVDANYPGSDNAYLSECANEILPEAIAAADALRIKLSEKLA